MVYSLWFVVLYCFISSDILVFAVQRRLKNFCQNVLHNYLSVMSKVVLAVFLERVHSSLSYTMSLVDHVLVINTNACVFFSSGSRTTSAYCII